MPKSVTHYAGEIIHANGHILPGWAACCFGEKAMKIRQERRHTLDREKVTCRGCLKMIEKADQWSERSLQRDHCAKMLQLDAQARQRGENIDGSVRRETVAKAKGEAWDAKP